MCHHGTMESARAVLVFSAAALAAAAQEAASPPDAPARASRRGSSEPLREEDPVRALERARRTPGASLFEPGADYAGFRARVTDQDRTGVFFKVRADTTNVRFLRVGDVVGFKPAGPVRGRRPCRGVVADSEKEGFLVLRVETAVPCLGSGARRLRLGSMLDLVSTDLDRRVQEAARARERLLSRREDFLEQLNGINRFLWSYDQQRVVVAGEYDARIMDLEREKRRALDGLVSRKRDSIRLQGELGRRFDLLDRDLDFHRIDGGGRGAAGPDPAPGAAPRGPRALAGDAFFGISD